MPSREMTLEEWVRRLPPVHRARQEYEALRAAHQERDADARRLVQAAFNVCERWHRCRNDRRDAHGMDDATDALHHAAYALEQRIDAAMAADTQTEEAEHGE